jgi:hypothetical protein
MNNAKQHFINCGYGEYFRLNIHQKINERQQRNALNINYLFGTVVRMCSHSRYETTHPQVNNGLYHHIGKTHSKYPKAKGI